MKQVGFFERADVNEVKAKKGAGRRASRVTQASLESIREIGPEAVRDMNPSARTFNMDPDIPGTCDILFLGEAPGEQEDHSGRPFVGASGKLLRGSLPGSMRSLAGFENVCRVRPPDNRNPTEAEIEAFRNEVEATILEAAPYVVVPLGNVPMSWFISKTKISSVRGSMHAARVGDLSFFVTPTWHPSYILRNKDAKKSIKGENLNGREIMQCWKADLEAACKVARRGKRPKTLTRDWLLSNTDLVCTKKDFIRCVRKLDPDVVWAYDLETHGKRPYAADGRILTMSVSDGHYCVVIAVEHSGASERQQQEGVKAVRWFFRDNEWENGLAAAGADYDLEWIVAYCGPEIVQQHRWDCVQQMTYTLDQRQGIQNLNYLGFRHYGIRIKDELDEGRMRDKLDQLKLDRVMAYNGGDAKLTAAVAHRAMRPLRRNKLVGPYERQMRRVVSTVLMQRKGLPIDQGRREELLKEVTAKRTAAEEDLRSTDAVVEFEQQQRQRINLRSGQQIAKVLVEHEGLDLRNEAGKVSTDAAILEKYREDSPVIAALLEMRKWDKIGGTYLRRFAPDAKDSYIWADGLVHCNYKLSWTLTSRLACEEPNNQNWPKRDPDGKRVRLIVRPPANFRIYAGDLGQGEFRVIAMHSRDKTVRRAILEGYDVHLAWAERIAQADSSTYRRHDRNIKRLRTAVKNQMVFPAFYGASVKRIAKELGIPLSIAEMLFEEFWDEFAGVKAWQERLLRDFKRNGYVESLTGRRFFAPMAYNNIINTPIQADCSDLLCDAMDELAIRALEEDKPYLMPALNIHDDVTTWSHKRHGDEIIDSYARALCRKRYKWISVPIMAEMEAGRDWFSTKPVAVFDTRDFQ